MTRTLLTLTLPLYVADQVTKWLALGFIEEGSGIEIIPGFFWLVLVYNTGAAFGMLANNNGFFIGLSVVALVVLSVLVRKRAFVGTWPTVAVGILVAGIFGNLTDRILHGHVVDFLDFYLPFYGHWPAFNIADMCICGAAGIFIIHSFFEGKVKEG